jgi:uncharacterized membrane protein YdcZ (DUF606 family)
MAAEQATGTKLVGTLVAVVIDASLVVQTGVNSSLAREFGSILPAGFVSFFGGTMLLAALNGVLYTRLRRRSRAQGAPMPSFTWQGLH